MNELKIHLSEESATQSVGELLAQCVRAPLNLAFNGPLGAGKSTLIRALLRKLGVQGSIKSPTYALVEPYSLSNYFVYHFDFYRFFDENEWEDSGFRDYFNPHSICLVEWAEKAGRVLPPMDLEISMSYDIQSPQSGRTLHIQSCSPSGHEIVKQLQDALKR